MNLQKFEVFTLLLWEVPFSFLLSPRLLNSLLRREVLIICYVFMKEIDSLRSVFMGKESAKCLLAIVEDLMSNVTTGNFARTFRDGEKVFILQLGSNAHGSIL